MTKKSKANTTHQATVAAAALEVAAKSIRETIPKDAPNLQAGTIGLELAPLISGDLVVTKPVLPGEPKTVADVKADDLLAAIAATMKPEAFSVVVEPAFELLLHTRKGRKADREKSAAQLELGKAMSDRVTGTRAIELGLTKTHQFKGRAGQIKGRPGVTITGNIEGRDIDLGFEG